VIAIARIGVEIVADNSFRHRDPRSEFVPQMLVLGMNQVSETCGGQEIRLYLSVGQTDALALTVPDSRAFAGATLSVSLAGTVPAQTTMLRSWQAVADKPQ
jgi:uncharacterized protein with GYD domain